LAISTAEAFKSLRIASLTLGAGASTGPSIKLTNTHKEYRMKTDRLEVRINPDWRRVWRLEAERQGLTLSAWVLANLFKACNPIGKEAPNGK
jgi:hypothetical protein